MRVLIACIRQFIHIMVSGHKLDSACLPLHCSLGGYDAKGRVAFIGCQCGKVFYAAGRDE